MSIYFICYQKVIIYAHYILFLFVSLTGIYFEFCPEAALSMTILM